jgi:hypothetical protein
VCWLLSFKVMLRILVAQAGIVGLVRRHERYFAAIRSEQPVYAGIRL